MSGVTSRELQVESDKSRMVSQEQQVLSDKSDKYPFTPEVRLAILISQKSSDLITIV